MHSSISVTMITKNASTFLAESLTALACFDEIIVLDNGSSDATIDIAQSFGNVKVYESEFIGFGPLKNLALSHASYDWILSVDSDEILSPALVEEIGELILDEKKVYAILRDNYYRDRHMLCCGWQGDFVMRLFHKKSVKFNDNQVHESLELPKDTKVIKLTHTMKHYTYQSTAQLIAKMDYYSTLWAEEYRGKKSSSPRKAMMRSLFAFVKFYIFKKGFLYGYEGLLISVTNTNAVFYKYMKLYEANHQILPKSKSKPQASNSNRTLSL